MHKEQIPIAGDTRLWSDLLLIDPQFRWRPEILERLPYDDARAEWFLRWYINDGGPLQPWGAKVQLDQAFRFSRDLGNGFLPAVWFTIAQVATGAYSVPQCSICGEPYPLQKGERVPTLIRNNYCAECGKKTNYRISKKEGNARARKKYRELAAHFFSDPDVELPELRLMWNDAHPEEAFRDVESMMKAALDAASGSYGALGSAADRARLTAILERGYTSGGNGVTTEEA